METASPREQDPAEGGKAQRMISTRTRTHETTPRGTLSSWHSSNYRQEPEPKMELTVWFFHSVSWLLDPLPSPGLFVCLFYPVGRSVLLRGLQERGPEREQPSLCLWGWSESQWRVCVEGLSLSVGCVATRPCVVKILAAPPCGGLYSLDMLMLDSATVFSWPMNCEWE